MSKITSTSSKLIFFIIWFVYLVFYSLATTIIRENGYLNFEPLFITSHINTLFDRGELVKNLFLSYPVLTNVLAYPFSVFSAIDAPFFASIFYTSLFTTTVVTIVGNKNNKVVKTLLFLYFLFSPITFYAATSGTSLYAFYILYFLIFSYLFNYIKKFTTYHITILSIVLSLVVFLDYRILWILLILIFHAFAFSVYGIKGLLTNPSVKYVKITQNSSLRRKYIGHLNSLVFIVGFFPLATLLIYLFINYLMGDNSHYFYETLTARWNGNHDLSLLNKENLITNLDEKAVNEFSFLFVVSFITPLFLFQLVDNYKKELKVLVLMSVPALLYVLVRESKIEYMGLHYYILLLGVAIASISTASNGCLSKNRSRYIVYTFMFLLSIYGECNYLKKSIYSSEEIFYNSVVEHKNNKELEDFKAAGIFLKYNTPENSKVLCDRSIMYPVIAYSARNNKFISNVSEKYKLAIREPAKYCNYLILSNHKSSLYFLDKLATRFEEKKRFKDSKYRSRVVFSCKTLRIIEFIK